MKKLIALLTVFVLATAMLVGCGGGEVADKGTIAVVAKGESHAFWQSVKAGAEAAGAKYGYNITFRGPASESAKDLPSQMEMVQTALSNNASAIVLATTSGLTLNAIIIAPETFASVTSDSVTPPTFE